MHVSYDEKIGGVIAKDKGSIPQTRGWVYPLRDSAPPYSN